MILETWVDRLPRDRKVALLVRHAERAPIVRIEDATEAGLTGKGWSDAERLGELLAPWSPLVVSHSFIGRCTDTAKAIAAGAEAQGATVVLRGILPILGGPYLRNWNVVMRRVIAEGAGSFVRDWFAGKLPPEQVADPLEAAREQLSLLLQQLGDQGKRAVYINVTHDWNLLLVRHFFFDRRQGNQRWPDYLEAVAAWYEGGVVFLQQGLRSVPLPGDEMR